MASELPYERGTLLRSTSDDHAKLREAWRVVRERSTLACPSST